MKIITIQFDGGCVPNPGQMYGSYSLEIKDLEVLRVDSRIPFGYGTSNVAEFMALHTALMCMAGTLIQHQVNPKEFFLKIFTDSTILKNRINRRNKMSKSVHPKSEGAQRMALWTNKCLILIDYLKGHQIVWQERDFNVRKFGSGTV